MHLPEDTPEIVAKLIEYLYRGKYTVDLKYLPSIEKEFTASWEFLSSLVGTSIPIATLPTHLSKPQDVRARNIYNLKIFHTCVLILAEKYDVPGLLRLSAAESRAITFSNEWESLAYWRFVYQSSGPQSVLRITNNLDSPKENPFSYDINSMKAWILRLWRGEGGAKGSRNGQSKFLECLKESPELARDFLVIISGGSNVSASTSLFPGS